LTEEFLECHLQVPGEAVVRSSHTLAYLGNAKIATELWSEEIKIDIQLLTFLSSEENKIASAQFPSFLTMKTRGLQENRTGKTVLSFSYIHTCHNKDTNDIYTTILKNKSVFKKQ